MARLDILARYESSAFLQRIYTPPNYLLPNVGGDILGVALAQILPIDLVGQVVVAAIIILQVSGVCALHYAIWRRLSAWPFVSVLLVYNFILLYGFLNYGLGIGLALWGVALRFSLASRRVWVRLLVGCAVALLVYFAHLAAFGMYALLMGSLSASELFRDARENRTWPNMRQAIVDALTFAPPLFLFLQSRTLQAGELHFAVDFLGFIKSKLFTVPTPVSFGNAWLDVTHIATWTAVLIGIGLLARPRFHPSLWLFLAAGTLTFLIAPSGALGGWALDARMPIFLALSAVAFVDLEPKNAVAFRRLKTLLTAAVLVRTCAIALAWYSSQPPLKEAVAALRILPARAVVFSASVDPWPTLRRAWRQNWAPPMVHVVSYAGLGRDVFVPVIWAHPAQQPIGVRPEFRRAYVEQASYRPLARGAEDLGQMAARFRRSIGFEPAYLLLLGDQTPAIALPNADVVARGQRFLLIALP